MQPYLYPYLGYYQLLAEVDTFVVFDDVNFIKKGFIHRNFIPVFGIKKQFNLSLKKASQNKLINEIDINDPITQCIPLIENTYINKCNYSDDILSIINFHKTIEEENLAEFLKRTIEYMSYNLLEQSPNIINSSSLKVQKNNGAEQRIIDIVLSLGGTSYYNLPGGVDLYSPSNFNDAGIDLKFIRPNINLNGEDNNYSVIDVIANMGIKRLRKKLSNA